MYGKLLKDKLDEFNISQSAFAREIKKRKPRLKIDRPRITRYCSGEVELSRDLMKEFLVYGFNYNPEEAEQIISAFVVRMEKETLGADKLHEILMKDSTPIVADEMIPAYSKLPIYKSLKDAYMEKGEIIGYFPKPPGLEDVPDNQLFWTPKPKGLILTNRVVNELEHGLRYVFKYDDDYSISRYSMPIDRQKIKPVGAIVGDFMFEQRLEN